jgi:hypothetical protein
MSRTPQMGDLFDSINHGRTLEIDIEERPLMKDTCDEVEVPIVSVIYLRAGHRGFQRAGAAVSRPSRQEDPGAGLRV